MKPRVCVLKTDGVNCNEETAHAFELAGGSPEQVHVNTLRNSRSKLLDYQILALSGGFSYGDDVASGRILAVELISRLRNSLDGFVDHGGLIIGICNGIQVLVKTGLLPFLTIGRQHVTLTDNDIGHFRCAWVPLEVKQSPCIFTQGLIGMTIELPIAHGEGKFVAMPTVLQQVEDDGLVAIRYKSDVFPANPNGSLHNIAGICDSTGRVFGLMPHPERFVDLTQYVNWRRQPDIQPYGLEMFRSAVKAIS